MTTTTRRITFAVITLALLNLALYAANTKRWKAPEYAEKIKNPITSTAASLDTGKKLYIHECLDCHGKSGKGDGSAAKDLEQRPPSLRLDEFQSQTDGALFWKITRGRREMPAYRKPLSDEERWHVINYLRTFAEVNTAQAKGANP
jgi:mono/diheme cytochrome c family protein